MSECTCGQWIDPTCPVHKLAADVPPVGAASEEPVKVCLCGSSRFPSAHFAAMMEETLAGRIVIPMGCYGHADFPAGARAATNDGDESTEVKQMLDRLHFAKIDASDEVLVITVAGYFGDSTKREIVYAERSGKRVRYKDFSKEEADELSALRSQVRALEEKLRLETALPTHLLDVHAIAEERDQMRERVRALEGEKQYMEHLRRQSKCDLREIVDLRTEVIAARDLCDDLRAENADLKAKLGQTRKEREDLRAKLETAAREREKWKQWQEATRQGGQVLAAERDSLRQQLADIQKQNPTL